MTENSMAGGAVERRSSTVSGEAERGPSVPLGAGGPVSTACPGLTGQRRLSAVRGAAGFSRPAWQILFCLVCLALGPLCLSGCTGDGSYLTTVVPGTLSAQLDAGQQRFTSDGWLLVSGGYAASLTSINLQVSAVLLSGAADYPGATGPPAPLLELTDGAALPVATRVPAEPLPGIPLLGCQPGCQLDQGTLSGAVVYLQNLQIVGAVRTQSGIAGPAQPLTVNVSLSDPATPGGVPVMDGRSVTLDGSVPQQIVVSATLELTAALLDGVDFPALPQNHGGLCLSDDATCQAPATVALLRANLLQSSLQLDLADPSGM